jgi:hypothetical protein
MGRWNHAMCDDCWTVWDPSHDPVRVREAYRESEKCCFCGAPTISGIYVRVDPDKTPCKGNHVQSDGTIC